MLPLKKKAPFRQLATSVCAVALAALLPVAAFGQEPTKTQAPQQSTSHSGFKLAKAYVIAGQARVSDAQISVSGRMDDGLEKPYPTFQVQCGYTIDPKSKEVKADHRLDVLAIYNERINDPSISRFENMNGLPIGRRISPALCSKADINGNENCSIAVERITKALNGSLQHETIHFSAGKRKTGQIVIDPTKRRFGMSVISNAVLTAGMHDATKLCNSIISQIKPGTITSPNAETARQNILNGQAKEMKLIFDNAK